MSQTVLGRSRKMQDVAQHVPACVSPEKWIFISNGWLNTQIQIQSNNIKHVCTFFWLCLLVVVFIVKEIQTAEVETLIHCSITTHNSSPFEVFELGTIKDSCLCGIYSFETYIDPFRHWWQSRNNYTRSKLLEMLDNEGFANQYNFVQLAFAQKVWVRLGDFWKSDSTPRSSPWNPGSWRVMQSPRHIDDWIHLTILELQWRFKFAPTW